MVHNKTSKEVERKIVERYVNGESQKEIADDLGTYNTTIRRILLRNDVKVRGGAEANRSIKSNPFDDDSFEAQYFLGYIIADGCIASKDWRHFKYSIRLNTTLDRDILVHYKKWLGTTNKITEYVNNRYVRADGSKYGKSEYCLGICSDLIWNYMNSIGITPRKSLDMKLKIPMTMPMVLGIFDGDGSVSRANARKDNSTGISWRISVAAMQLAKQIYWFMKQNNYPVRATKYNGMYTISLHKRESVERLYNHLYTNAVVFSKRKYEKFGSLLEKSSK